MSYPLDNYSTVGTSGCVGALHVRMLHVLQHAKYDIHHLARRKAQGEYFIPAPYTHGFDCTHAI